MCCVAVAVGVFAGVAAGVSVGCSVGANVGCSVEVSSVVITSVWVISLAWASVGNSSVGTGSVPCSTSGVVCGSSVRSGVLTITTLSVVPGELGPAEGPVSFELTEQPVNKTTVIKIDRTKHPRLYTLFIINTPNPKKEIIYSFGLSFPDNYNPWVLARIRFSMSFFFSCFLKIIMIIAPTKIIAAKT